MWEYWIQSPSKVTIVTETEVEICGVKYCQIT